jgi:general secretion pathway protein I
VATLLARAKMIDIEQTLHDDGFSNDDDEQSGDFSEEGWPSFKWRARILAPKTQGVPPEQLISAVLGIPLGEGDAESDPLAGMVAALTGGQGAAGGANPAAAAALGPMAALIQGQFTALIDQISKSVREVHLTVYFKDGTETESIDLVTHVVSTGKGSDRNSGVGGASAAAQASGQDPWVNEQTGVAIAGEPVPCRTGGGLCDPANPTQRVVRLSEWLRSRGTGQAPGGIQQGLRGFGPGSQFVPGAGGFTK